MQAVILAAGMGTRIREHHKLPKGFITINDKPLIMHSIEALNKHGITDILVVTGYLASSYKELAADTTLFEVAYNPKFDTQGSLYSLYCSRNWVAEELLILESDIVYESRAIAALLGDESSNAILTSLLTEAGDEVYVAAKEGQLKGLSKNKEDFPASSIMGEFVGINKLSYAAYQRLLCLMEQDINLLTQGHYEEDGLIALSKSIPLHCVLMEDLKWGEVDTIEHLQRVEQLFKFMLPEVATVSDRESLAAE